MGGHCHLATADTPPEMDLLFKMLCSNGILHNFYIFIGVNYNFVTLKMIFNVFFETHKDCCSVLFAPIRAFYTFL